MTWDLPAPSPTAKLAAANWKAAGVGEGVGEAVGVGVGVGAVDVPTKMSCWLPSRLSPPKLGGEKARPGAEGVTTKLPPGVVLRRRKLPSESVSTESEFA